MEQSKGYVDFTADDGRVVPLKIETHTIIPPEHLAKNIAENLKRTIPRFVNRIGFCEVKSEPLAIVAAGPSLNDTVDLVRDFDRVLVCGSAHDHLVRQGVIPTYALVSDGGKDDKGNLSLPQKETTYLIASQCDPGLFNHLSGFNVEMWHYRGQACPSVEVEAELLQGETSIAWGSTVTINSIQIAMMLGYQHLHFFGFDSCYGDYGVKHHCCDIAGSMEYQKVPAVVDGKMFISDLGLMTQAEQFFHLVEAQGEFFHSTIYGDGLIAEMVKKGDPGLGKFISLA